MTILDQFRQEKDSAERLILTDCGPTIEETLRRFVEKTGARVSGISVDVSMVRNHADDVGAPFVTSISISFDYPY